MADNRIRVKLSPVTAVPAGGIDTGPSNKKPKAVIVGLKVSLTRKGKGQTLATPAAQPATLTFFEVAQKKDANQAPRKFATLKGAIRLDNDVPIFDVQFKAIAYEAFVRGPRFGNSGIFMPKLSSDFHLRMELESPSFEQQGDTQFENGKLFLPWEFNGENEKLEIDTQLEIGSQIESPLGSNAILDLTFAHPKVLEDAKGPIARNYFGVTTVYSNANEIFAQLKISSKVLMPNKAITINLHRSVDAQASSIQAVASALRDIFADAGITATVNVSRSDQDANSAGFRRRSFNRGTAFMSSNVQDLDAPNVGEGTRLPFFEYWAFVEKDLSPASSESAESEAIQQFEAATQRKVLFAPIHMLVGTGKPFETTLAQVGTPADKDQVIANIVAHEVGHSLGFPHGLCLRNQAYVQTGNPNDIARGIMMSPNLVGGQVIQARLSPLDKAILARDYF